MLLIHLFPYSVSFIFTPKNLPNTTQMPPKHPQIPPQHTPKHPPKTTPKCPQTPKTTQI